MYNINSAKRYKVTFLKDAGAFKKDQESMVGMVIAIKYINKGWVKADKELYADAKAFGCDKMIKKVTE